MGNLLGGGTNLNDRSLLKERWDQDESNLINVSSVGLTGPRTIYTVTAGKKLYIKHLFIQESGNVVGRSMSLKDGGLRS